MTNWWTKTKFHLLEQIESTCSECHLSKNQRWLDFVCLVQILNTLRLICDCLDCMICLGQCIHLGFKNFKWWISLQVIAYLAKCFKGSQEYLINSLIVFHTSNFIHMLNSILLNLQVVKQKEFGEVVMNRIKFRKTRK